ncbi:MAG: alcohol acetyltransferase [Ruminococcaceae bacterium]|nr:alcohol acetyltransferase [Oscillospiraceae bacterium]
MGRFFKTKSKWIKLDNAAKIYPAAMSRSWASIFRLSATLTENVDPDILNRALKITLKRFPSFGYRLRSGFFWNFLEQITADPVVQKDVSNPCLRMRLNENGGYMFRVRYFGRRIAVEIFHVLTDGTGGLIFLKTLVAEYLTLKYGVEIPRDNEIFDVSSPPDPLELEDSFLRYSRKATASRVEDASYKITGTPERTNTINIITGQIPVDVLRKVSKKYNCSITEFLTALLILSVRQIQQKEINLRKRNRPIKVSIPINLRKFYPTKTLRNFSSFINPGIQPIYGEYSLEETISAVKHFLGLEGTEKMLNARMSANVVSEQNIFIRLAPLFIKNSVLKIAYRSIGDRTSSTTLSNMGNQMLPSPMNKYVTRMDFVLGVPKYNSVSCGCISYNNNLCLTFSRNIVEAELERIFFRKLVNLDIPVEVESNRRY